MTAAYISPHTPDPTLKGEPDPGTGRDWSRGHRGLVLIGDSTVHSNDHVTPARSCSAPVRHWPVPAPPFMKFWSPAAPRAKLYGFHVVDHPKGGDARVSPRSPHDVVPVKGIAEVALTGTQQQPPGAIFFHLLGRWNRTRNRAIATTATGSGRATGRGGRQQPGVHSGQHTTIRQGAN